MDACSDYEVTSENYDEDEIPMPRKQSSLKQPFKRSTAKKKVQVEHVAEPSQKKKMFMNPDEEKALLVTMKDLAREGWKAGHGWRRGVYEKAAVRIRQLVPGSSVRGPNVDNKLHFWTKQYRLLTDFAKRSGVSLDPATHSVVVDSEDIWKELQEVDSSFLQLRRKFFPYYDQWADLFGQNRATGAGARDHSTSEAPSDHPPTIMDMIDEFEEEALLPSEQATKTTPVLEKSASTVDDQSRYRTRKGHLATNVLGVCDTECRFIYMLASWEGSAADSRVLSDAVTRPNGLRVQRGTYYLCDSGYTNDEGFLTPFRQTRYHLQEWGPGNRRPQDSKELFNLCHASARNVIERAFGILKKRFAVLRSPSFYPVQTQCDIILACALLHNFVIKVTSQDPLSRAKKSFIL